MKHGKQTIAQVAVLAMAASMTLAAGVTPASVEITLAPGESAEVEKTVETPVGSPRADVYFLADTTGSMGSALDDVQSSFAGILDQLNGTGNDIAVGAGDYKDFPFDSYAFQNGTSITADGGTAATSTVNAWSATGGSDGSEGQLYALHRLATDSDIGWRADAARIAVWFGDAPGHDPVCAAISGEDADITEASATADLQAAGISVIAVSTIVAGYPDGLNDDPTSSAGDYSADCDVIGGSTGQATRIADATGGLYLDAPSNDQVADTILAALETLPFDVVPQASCDDGLSIATAPESHADVAPGDSVTFTETVTAGNDLAPGTYECSVAFTLNGSVSDAFTQAVTVTVEAPEPDPTSPTPTDEPTSPAPTDPEPTDEPTSPAPTDPEPTDDPSPLGPVVETDLPGSGGNATPLVAAGLLAMLLLGLGLRWSSDRQ